MNGSDADPGHELRCRLALNRAPLLGSRRFAALLARFGSAAAVLAADPDEWCGTGLPERTLAFLHQPDWESVAADLDWLQRPGHHCLQWGTADYPRLLAEIADPPPLLFLRGDPAALHRDLIAVVGSRNPSPSGNRAATQLARDLAAAGLGIVSGLALGIDAACHRGALAADGITVAVLGNGADHIYPRQHQSLAEDILEHDGALVSEFPPGVGPRAENFPRRNRIISGLTLGTLVIEAAPRSGSLITARLALEQNREVFAVPGSIYNPLALGCNGLIQQGAKLVQRAEDVLEELALRPPQGISVTDPAASPAGLAPEPPLLKFIAYDPTSVDTLVAVTGETADSIISQLLHLELQGYIAPAAGGCYVRVK